MPDNNNHYLELVTHEYADKPKFNSMLSALLDKVVPINDCYLSYDIIFNINNAVGDQLDKIGEIIGLGRNLPLENEQIPSTLDDDLYRRVLKSRIYFNHWDGTIDGLKYILEQLFPGLVYDIVDAQDMSYSVYIINPEITDVETQLILEGYIIPKPSGVRVTYEVLDSPLFGWDSDAGFVRGWDQGNWSSN